MVKQNLKVALVYDRVNKWGGAERVLLALHEIWPEAPLYTAVYDPRRATWAKVFRVKPSFLQHFPWAKRYHEFYPWATPLAFETFTFDEFDVVISITSAEAKGIITKPQTLHICYCLTPTRYLWSGRELYRERPGMSWLSGPAKWAQKALVPTFRQWDLVAASRPDYYLAISQRVDRRIRQYYGRETERIIYPPVDLSKFKISNLKFKIENAGKYFLVVSRLVGYKRVDLVINAFNELGWPLVVIGEGWQKDELQSLAHRNIKFLGGYLTDGELVRYYQNCSALVHAADEDFGLAAVEAQACGRPVIAFRDSGIAEVVQEGKTGIFFAKQTKEALSIALTAFAGKRFNPEDCRKNALRFSQTRFRTDFSLAVAELYRKYRKI